MQDEILPGGWTKYSTPITSEAKTLFENVMESILGVQYEPLACATQVVNGINYSFLCNSRVVAPNTPWQPAIVAISNADGGKLLGIDRYEPIPPES